MGFTNLWPLFLLITIPLVIMLYILKRKYKEEVISSSLLWKEVYKNTRANTPWEKLRKNIMMLLQILILLALILALMKPFLNFGGKSYKNVVLVIDNTASMNVTYNDTTRLEESKKLAKEFLLGTKDGTNAYIISFDGNSNLLLNGDFDKETSTGIIDGISKSYGTGDINDVTSLVRAIGQGIGEDYEALIFTDKNVELGDINGKVVSLANSGINASVDNVSHKFIDNGVKVIATVTNRGEGVYEGDFSIFDGNELVAVEALVLQEGESKTLSFTVDQLQGDILIGELSRKDILLEDNIYYHVVGKKKTNKILIVTDQNVFLEKAFGVLENTEVFKTNDPSNITSTDNYDLYIFDNVTPDIMPSKGSLLFINPKSNEFFNVLNGGDIGEAEVVKGEVSRYLESTQFTLSNYNSIEVPYYGRSFLSVDEKSIGFKGDIDGRKIAALSFDLHHSDFALKKEFPILMYELGESLISTGMVNKSNFKASDKIVVKGIGSEGQITLTYPKGEIADVSSGDEVNSKAVLGIYKVSKENQEEKFSINFPSERESITNISSIGESENIAKEKVDLRRGLNISPLLIILAIMIVGFEWIMYKKGN